MALVVPDAGELILLEKALNQTNFAVDEDLTLKLYTNAYDPIETSVAGSFTECIVAGYIAKTLTSGSWGTATVANVTTASYAEQSWTFTAAGLDIEGYYIVGATSGTIHWAERFASPEPTYDQKVLKLTPKIIGS